MTIRRKLLILFLSVSLIPLILIIGVQRTSFRITGKKVTSDIRRVLDDYAIYNMESILHQFNMNLDLHVRLLESLLRLQSDEIEDILLGKNMRSREAPQGKSNGQIVSLESAKDFKEMQSVKSSYPFPVDFNQQNVFIVKNVPYKNVSRDLATLKYLTPIFRTIYKRSPNTIYWQHVSLENGLMLVYPKGPPLPEDLDPRKREWYTTAKKSNDLIWSLPYVDASTHKPMITVAMPVYRPDGDLAGVSAIDIHLPQIFSWMHLNPNWAEGAERMLLMPMGTAKTFKVLAHSSMTDSMQTWEKPLELETISSKDTSEFKKFTRDLIDGESGVRIMRYQGEKMVWVYGGGKHRVIALLLVPYKNIIALVNDTEKFLWQKNIEWMRYSALFVLLVLIAVILIVFNRSKKFTSPIMALAEAGQQLADGNFDAKVDIQTGDELQRLGEVFNEIGPKLREHQKLQQSIALAGAIQQRLLPHDVPHIPGFDIAGLCLYSDETGGDYYDFIEYEQDESGKIKIILGDVTGHGLSAALMMASARAMLRSNIRHFPGDIGKIMKDFNNELTIDSEPDKFITLFLAMLDPKDKTITWASGGHDPAIRYNPDKGVMEELSADGIPIGFLPNMEFKPAGPVKLVKGDILLIGTDGIWEAENEQEEMFGKDRLSKIVNENSDKTAEKLCQIIVNSVVEFCKPAKPQDDITVVIIKAL